MSGLVDFVWSLAGDSGPQVVIRVGTVTATSPLTVTLGASTTPTVGSVNRLSSYTPTTSDVVLVLLNGPAVIVLGKVV